MSRWTRVAWVLVIWSSTVDDDRDSVCQRRSRISRLGSVSKCGEGGLFGPLSLVS